MTTTPAARRAWLVGGICLLLTATAAVMIWSIGPLDVGSEPSPPAQRWIELFGTIPAAAAGAVIVARHPRNLIGWLFLTESALASVQQVAISYAAGFCTGVSDCNIVFLIAVDALWFPAVSIALGGLFLLFPDGRLPGRWRNWLWWGLVASGVTGAAVAPFKRDVFNLARAVNPWSSGAPTAIVEGIDNVVGFVAFLLAALAIIDFVLRARNATGVVRLQNRWLALAGLVTVLGGFAAIVGQSFGLELSFLFSLGAASIPISVAVAINRYRLYEIDRLFSRTVAYSLVIVLLGLVFFGALTLFAVFIPADSPLVVATSTLAAFALFNPLRRRVQIAVDRRFNRSRFDAQRIMDVFTGSLQDRVDGKAVLEGWLGVVSTTMEPSTLGVWVKGRPTKAGLP